jgi:hypothetical protein
MEIAHLLHPQQPESATAAAPFTVAFPLVPAGSVPGTSAPTPEFQHICLFMRRILAYPPAGGPL